MHYKWTLHSRTTKQVKHLWFAKLRFFCEFFSTEKDPQNSLNFKNEKKIVKFEFSIYVSQSVTGAGPRVVTEWWTHLTAERRRGWRTLCHVTRAVYNLYNIQWKTRHRKACVIFAENESKRSRARHLDSFKRNFSLLLHVCKSNVKLSTACRYVPKIGKLGLNLNCVAPMFVRLCK